MAQKFVGIDLGTHTVKAVVISSGLRGAQVLDVIEQEVTAAEGAGLDHAIATAIELLQSRRLEHEAVGLALPGGVASYRLLQFPFTDARRIAQAVPFEAEGQFPVALDQLQYDHVEGVAPSEGGRALMVAIERERLGTVADRFKDAGIDLKLVTTSGVAHAQAVRGPIPSLPEGADREAVLPVQLIIDIGHTTTEMIAVGDKGPVAVRSVRRAGRHVTESLARAYNMDQAAAEAAKHRDAFLPHRALGELSDEQLGSGKVVAEAIEPLVRELEHTRSWLRSAGDYEVTQIRLAGGGALLRGLVAYLAEQTGLPVEIVRPHGNPLRGDEGRDWTTTSAALGAAVATARRPLIQLHDVTVAREGNSGWIQERLSTLAALGVAIMAFGALDTMAQMKALEKEREVYNAELSEATSDMLGESLTSLDDIETRLAAVEGADLVSLVPQRGALDVLSMIVDAAAADDATAQQSPTPAEADAEGVDTGDEMGPTEPEGTPPGIILATPPGEAGAAEGGETTALPPVTDPTKIMRDDDVTFAMVDIRERKIEIKVSATRSSAQDRLALKLAQGGCLANIQKGKVRDQNERKVFEMSMDNNCFVASSGGGGG